MINICRNKNIFFIFAMSSMLVSFSVSAQEKKQQLQNDRASFQAQKNAYITAELGLTPEEAAAFIPLAEELDQKKFEASQSCKRLSHKVKKMDKCQDSDYDLVIQTCLELKMKEAELEKEYYTRFRAVLSPKKLYRYRNAEFKFFRRYFSEKAQ